jgi:predicted nucleotidyltransferase
VRREAEGALWRAIKLDRLVSAARGELREESDIDLLVLLSEPLDLFQELKTIVKVLHPLQLEATHWISAKPAAAAFLAQVN